MTRKLRELWVIILDDRKKAGVLGVLVLILLVFGAKYAINGATPRQSDAAHKGGEATVAEVGTSAVNRALASLGATSPGGVIGLPHTPPLSRNLFALKDAYFPPPPQTEPRITSPKATSTSEVEATPENADDINARIVARVEDKARSFKLKSVVLGANPIAVIETNSGRQRQVVRVGQVIDGFTLEEVTANSVLLEMETVRIRLSLFRTEK